MADEFDGLGVANTFFDTLLSADATLVSLVGDRIVADFSLETTAGQAALYPLVTYFNMSGGVIRAMGNILVATNPIYAVMAHGTGGYGVVGPVATRLAALLGNASAYPITYGGQTFSVDCWREGEIQPLPDILPGGRVAYARGSKVHLLIQMIS